MLGNKILPVVLAGVAVVGAACGDISTPVLPLAPGSSLHSGGSGSGGGGGGGGGTKIDGTNILPTAAPAPGILVRESFGPGPDMLRPTGGKGEAKPAYAGTTLGGFWAEYPGSKNAAWITPPETGQTWKLCAGGDNTGTENPWELPSPLQTTQSGCVASIWTDAITTFPTALLPVTFALPSDSYELSMEGYPAPIPEGYVAIGFTSSGVTSSNLTSSGALWLRVTDPTRSMYGIPLHYELRAGSLASGQLLASGDAGYRGWMHMAIRVSPAAGTVTVTFADAESVTVPFTMPAPKYLAFEGIGILDNLVLRK
jgi:hypothetical protein